VDGRFSCVKDIGPGKYRYLYVVDGVECVDRHAASVVEEGKMTNIFQVINPVIDTSNKGKLLPTSQTAMKQTTPSKRQLNRQLLTSMEPQVITLSHHRNSTQEPQSQLVVGTPTKSVVSGISNQYDETGMEGPDDTETNNYDDVNSTRQLLMPGSATSRSSSHGGGDCNDSRRSTTSQRTSDSAYKAPHEVRRHNSSTANQSRGSGGFSAVSKFAPNVVVHTVGKENTQDGEAEKAKLMNSLRRINLRNVALCDDGAWTFALFMQANGVVEEVDISYNGISDDGMQGIGSCMDELRALKLLNLCGNSFGADGCKYISDQLRIHPSIQTLELSKNYLGDDGAEYIAQILVHHVSLQTLILDSCLIGDDGVTAIADKLWHNRSLTQLNLGRNRISQVGVNILAHSVRSNGSLVDLKLYHNYLGPDGVRFIADMLVWNKTLTSLDLSATGMAAHGSLAGMLQFILCRVLAA
jgi:Ran GTPase-activating protein (RanGAP) involved in mRNA processing and transport